MSKLSGIGSFIYNPTTKEFLGRSCSSWLKIILFYHIYYAILASLFVLMMSIILYVVLSEDVPYLSGEASLLRGGPGVGVQPQFVDDDQGVVLSTMVHVVMNPDDKTFQLYENYTSKMLESFKPKSSQVDCSDASRNRSMNESCAFDVKQLGPCKSPADLLLKQKTLCVFVSANLVYGWIPDVKKDFQDSIAIECKGQNVADKENLGQPVYYPSLDVKGKIYGKISHQYFPFLGQKNYTRPVVAVSFPYVKYNVAVLIKCRVKGLKNAYDKSSRFEIMVDEE